MLKRCLVRLFAAGTLLTLPLSASSPAQACASLGRGGLPVTIASEEAVIIWDAAHQREDFIRQATFQTKASSIGFLVPTPTVPTLAQADPAIFPQLERLIHPMTRGSVGNTGYPLAKSAPAPQVRVLHFQQVAGYDAVVLAADNTQALTHWLKAHGYASSAQDNAWLKPYVQAHWKITAFKIAKSNTKAPTVTSSLVRMSFSTPQPFYPYREPAAPAVPRNLPTPRLLRVFLLANHPMQGRFQTASAGRPWPGTLVGTSRLSDFWRVMLARQTALAPMQLPSQLYLTTFEDYSSPRPSIADVVFQ